MRYEVYDDLLEIDLEEGEELIPVMVEEIDLEEAYSLEPEKKTPLRVREYTAEEKARLAEYMSAFLLCAVCACGVIDYYTHETFPESIEIYTDGEYTWTNMDLYHIETYNAAAEEHFIRKVMGIQSPTQGPLTKNRRADDPLQGRISRGAI